MNRNVKKLLLILTLISIFFIIPYFITKNIAISVVIALVAMVIAK